MRRHGASALPPASGGLRTSSFLEAVKVLLAGSVGKQSRSSRPPRGIAWQAAS